MLMINFVDIRMVHFLMTKKKSAYQHINASAHQNSGILPLKRHFRNKNVTKL